jgi:hypothetical protein
MGLIGTLKFRKIEKEVTNEAYWRNCFRMMSDLRSLIEFMSALKREELP